MKQKLATMALGLVAIGAVAQASASYDHTSPAALHDAIGADEVTVLLDVSAPVIYAAGHLPGAQNLPLEQLTSRLGELESLQDQTIAVISEDGRRSVEAAVLLSEAGYRVMNVRGGTRAWSEAGFPLE